MTNYNLFEASTLLGHVQCLNFQTALCQLTPQALQQHQPVPGQWLGMLSLPKSNPSTHTSEQAPFDCFWILRVQTWTRDSPALLACEFLGQFRRTMQTEQGWHFSRQVQFLQQPQIHQIYIPNSEWLQLMINGTLQSDKQIPLGHLRYNEQTDFDHPARTTWISMQDLLSKRTAMLGKTRMGKSNAVKIIAQGMIDTHSSNECVGQLVFDVSGEYSHSNTQDGTRTLASNNPERCKSYFLTDRAHLQGGQLMRFNFYQRTADVIQIMRELLPPQVLQIENVRSLLTVRLASLERDAHASEFLQHVFMRRAMFFWAILDAAGFTHDSDSIKTWLLGLGFATPFNPGFTPKLRLAAYQAIDNISPPAVPTNMAGLMDEINTVARFRSLYPNDPTLITHGRPTFDREEELLIRFLCPESGPGPDILRPCLTFHHALARDFTKEILHSLKHGQTVIVDLGSTQEHVVRYFAHSLCEAIFNEQERRFVRNELHDHFIQLYFEEAHTIFPAQLETARSVYSRIAKEGAKFHIGMVYATQSPATINQDLLVQTENFFIGHISSHSEVQFLSQLQIAFHGLEDNILFNRTPGLMHVLTHSHRYAVPVQVHRYDQISQSPDR